MADKKLGFGRLQCPQCPEVRQGRESLEEHRAVAHTNRPRAIAGAQEVLSGSDVMPSDVVSQLDQIVGTFQQEGKEMSAEDEMQVQTFAAKLPVWRGKPMPEFIIMWDPGARAVTVHSARWAELVFRKGYSLRPPDFAQYDKFWFHFTCPIPTCALNKETCERHGTTGRDSNHPLRSPEFMEIQHLQSGGRLHRQYFEMHKAELQQKYRDAFAAFEVEMESREIASKRAHEDDIRQKDEALAVAR